jgi:hypothetical protein
MHVYEGVSIHLKTRKIFRSISEEKYIHIWPNCNYIVEERGVDMSNSVKVQLSSTIRTKLA